MDKFRGYVLFHLSNGANSELHNSSLMIYSREGKLVRYRLFDRSRLIHNDKMFVIRSSSGDKIYLISDKFVELNDRLDVIRSTKLPFETRIVTCQADVDGDGTDEFLIYSARDKKMAIYNSELQKLSEFAFSASEELMEI